MPYSVFQTGDQGYFLTLDLGSERISFPYAALAKAIFSEGDRIALEFPENRIDIVGAGLEELFGLLTRGKVDTIRRASGPDKSVREISVSE
ncbi:MAG: hypothetical protein QM790_18915 [Nibricoccus sp.]